MKLDSDQQYLKKMIGEKGYRALREGRAVLRIWRNSSPHNWWVESKRGIMYWHSSSEDFIRPPLSLFVKVEDSKDKVIQYWGSDSGMPQESTYLLREVHHGKSSARKDHSRNRPQSRK